MHIFLAENIDVSSSNPRAPLWNFIKHARALADGKQPHENLNVPFHERQSVLIVERAWNNGQTDDALFVENESEATLSSTSSSIRRVATKRNHRDHVRLIVRLQKQKGDWTYIDVEHYSLAQVISLRQL